MCLFLSTIYGSESTLFQSTIATQGWYSADPVDLKQDLKSLLLASTATPVSNPITIIMPHAGYAYSGTVMASGIKAIKTAHFDRIVIIGPSHYASLPNQATVIVAETIQTPLGNAPIDQKAIRYLLTHKEILNQPQLHSKEHSVQIEIPWVQTAFPNTPIVPIVLGQLDREGVSRIAAILRPLLTTKTLLIISSDFTHYGKDYNYVPFTESIPENIQRLDTTALNHIQKKSLLGFQSFIEITQDTICGHMPIQLLLELLPSNALPHPIAYMTSAQLNGNWDHSVSYASVVFSGTWTNDVWGIPYPQAEAEGKRLLAYARQCIESYLKKGKVTPTLKLSAALNKKTSVFVTLKKNGQLRGCIGSIFPTQSLTDEIKTQAIQAASHDPRFQPLPLSELKDCEIELSILTPIKTCHNYQDIQLGKDGIILKKGSHEALFLPQVATEQGWDLDTTLTALSEKAGLPGDAWKSKTDFYVFRATVFTEEKRD